MGGVVTWDPEDCPVPPVASPTDPTEAQWWTLTRDYCVSLGEQGCLSSETSWRGPLDECSVDEQVDACVGDLLSIRHEQVLPECDAAWRDSIECGTSATHDNRCTGASIDFPYGPREACGARSDALLECVEQHSTRIALTKATPIRVRTASSLAFCPKLSCWPPPCGM
jgi:hypothetical protein